MEDQSCEEDMHSVTPRYADRAIGKERAHTKDTYCKEGEREKESDRESGRMERETGQCLEE